ncbi:transcriptional regulator with XRE-family HTH domain [Saccharothrix coeruleofusca]|uniref:helix-turn-helix domain-containing protein n=1 Tax=Saccharothrix coeruleofusca TaxID=33919 RepID=UPI001AE94079|nr:helix-turn-helix transcriptional regulator [Saccharothrix coeruleofusca]MBP2334570.1 transcriptional regulator with XRE-family HTH domain [Saccharothrix coeruleofusca]
MTRQKSGVITRGIGFELERLRTAAKLTLQDVGNGLGVSASTISRLENGKREPTPEEVSAILAVIGVIGPERNRLLDRARGGDGSGLLEASNPTVQSRTYTNFETRATVITDFELMLVPGLAQTPEYAYAVISAIQVDEEEPSIEVRVGRRMARQAILARRTPPELNLIITEAALRLPIGGPKVMARQVKHLIDLTDRANVTILVIPSAVVGYAGLLGQFVIFDFASDRPVVHIEDRTTGLFLDDPAKVSLYRLTVEKLTDVALDEQDSVRLMTSIAHDLDRE